MLGILPQLKYSANSSGLSQEQDISFSVKRSSPLSPPYCVDFKITTFNPRGPSMLRKGQSHCEGLGPSVKKGIQRKDEDSLCLMYRRFIRSSFQNGQR